MIFSSVFRGIRLPTFIGLLYLPVILLTLTLKLIRGIDNHAVTDWLSALYYLHIDALFLCWLTLLLCFLLHLFCFSKKTTLVKITLVCGGFIWLYLLCVELLTHSVYLESGFILSWDLIEFGLERRTIAMQMMAEKAHPCMLLYGLFGLAYFLAALYVCRRVGASQRHPEPNQDASRPLKFIAYFPTFSLKLRALGLAFLFGLLSTLLLLGANTKTAQSEFRGSALHIGYGLAHRLLEAMTPSVAVKPAPRSTSNTPLVRTPEFGKIKNVAIIILESTRQQSVAPYVKTEVTPFFNQLAKRSQLALHAYSTSPHTSRAVYSILCSQFPRSGRGIVESTKNGITSDCLAHFLQQQGFATAYFQSATESFEYRRQLVENMGFEEFYPLESFDKKGFQKANYFGYEDNIMLPASRQWLSQQNQRPFLATYLTVTPHFHYDKINSHHWQDYSENAVYNAYQNALSYQDAFLQKLFQQYTDLGLYQDTLFVVLGDHGEGFKEHKLWGHGNLIFEEGVKVPLLFHANGELKGRIQARTTLLDVAPTVLDILGLTGYDTLLAGASLQHPLVARDILLECVSPETCSALIEGETDLKLIHHYGEEADHLYTLDIDPEEKNNLIDDPSQADNVARIKQKLLARISKVKIGESIKYDSWGANKRQPNYTTQVPKLYTAANIQHKKQQSRNTLIGVSIQSESIKAGEPLTLELHLNGVQKELCITIELQGAAWHSKSKYALQASAKPYITLSEKVMLMDTISTLNIDVSGRTTCDDESELLFNSHIALPVTPKETNNNPLYVKSGETFYYIKNGNTEAQQLKLDTAARVLFSQTTPYSQLKQIQVNETIGSQVFFHELKNELHGHQLGNVTSASLDSTWQARSDDPVTIYRYKLTYPNQTLDLRIHVQNNTIEALTYYLPWRKEFEL